MAGTNAVVGGELIMPIAQRTVTLVHSQGLHARPAALFVQLAKQFESKVTMKKGRKIVDGKSIMGLLTLAARPGARISIITEGPDAEMALERLTALVTRPLDEPPRASHGT